MRRHFKALVFALAALTLPLCTLLAQPHRPVRTSLSPLAQPQFDRGQAAAEHRMVEMSVAMRRLPEQQAALEKLLADQQDPASPLYHQWLTPEEFADRFGATQQDVDETVAWLQSNGFTVTQVARGRDYIGFNGTASQVELAFQAQIRRFEVNGETHYANTVEPRLPGRLAQIVAGVHGLNDFRPKPPKRRAAFRSMTLAGVAPRPQFYSDAYPDLNVLAPDDLATIYNIKALYRAGIDGSGQKIAIVGASDIDMSDIQYFRSAFGLPPNDPRKILVPGSTNPGQNGAMGEADLDLEWSGAIAPKATILYVFAEDPVTPTFYAIDQALAPVISYSFGLCELRTPPSDLDIFAAQAQKAAAMGITWVASSGDSGASACEDQNGGFNSAITRMNVNVPANLPEVTAVGGTEFNEGNGNYWSSPRGNGGSALGYVPERAWTDEGLIVQNELAGFASSGGGASLYVSKPAWQKGVGVPADGARDVPDVSLTASWFHDPYALISGGEFFPSGGTSASAPSFAGIVALLNQYVVANGGRAGLGNINPMLYSLAQSAPGAFHDVTTGSNIVPCVIRSTQDCTTGTMGYRAGTGYDLVTGLGSVDAYALAQAWRQQAARTPQLAITQLTASTSVKVGGSFTMSMVVTNQGLADAGAFQARLYFTTDGTTATAKAFYVYCDAVGLAAGAHFTCSGTLNLGSSITAGKYLLLGVADTATALASTGPLTVTR